MVVDARLQMLRRSALAGVTMVVHVGPAQDPTKCKVRCVVYPKRPPMQPTSQRTIVAVLDALAAVADVCIAVDKGHAHSDGQLSETSIWLQLPPSADHRVDVGAPPKRTDVVLESQHCEQTAHAPVAVSQIVERDIGDPTQCEEVVHAFDASSAPCENCASVIVTPTIGFTTTASTSQMVSVMPSTTPTTTLTVSGAGGAAGVSTARASAACAAYFDLCRD